MSNYVYMKSERQLWTTGFYAPDGNWEPESDYGSKEEAVARVVLLNGGNPFDNVPFAPNKPQVKIYEKDVYGKTLIYPHNDAAKAFAEIARTVTLSKDHIKQIQSLGFEVVRVFEPRGD